MPVGGFYRKGVWQYVFLPQPVTLLYRGWDWHDREWEHNVVERLQRGEAAPRSLSLNDLVCDSHYWGTCDGGWETCERRSINADRSKSAFLTDEAIAQRSPGRKLRKKAHEELLERNKRIWEEEKPRREAEAAKQAAEAEAIRVARIEAVKEYDRKMEERMQAELQRAKDWEQADPRFILEQFQPKYSHSSKAMWDKYVEDMEKKSGR